MEKELYTLSTRVKILTLLLVLVLCFLIEMGRFLHPMFMFEDGAIFFSQAYTYGIKSLILPYAGYLHFALRIGAYFTSFFPFRFAPIIYNYIGVFILLLTCWHLMSDRIKLPYKPFLAIAIISVPAPLVFANLTDAQWIVAVLLLILFCKVPPATRREKISDFTLLVICGLTGPFLLLFSPVIFLKYLGEKNRHYFYLTAVLLIMVQGYFIIHTHGGMAPTKHHHMAPFMQAVFQWVRVFGFQFFEYALPSGWAKQHIPLWARYLSGLTVVILHSVMVVYSLKNRSGYVGRVKQYIIAIMYFLLLAGFYRTYVTFGDLRPVMPGVRYLHAPILISIWLLFLLCASTSGWKRKAALASLMLVLAFPAVRYFVRYKGNDHTYSDNWAYYSAQLEKGCSIDAPTNPKDWHVVIHTGKRC
jgi:hypothetical protein